jgi:hypothetical protein
VAGFREWYGPISFAVASSLAIVLIRRMNARRHALARVEPERYSMTASAGAD